MIDWTSTLAPAGGALENIASFGEDAIGNIYIANFFTGDVFRIVRRGDVNNDGALNFLDITAYIRALASEGNEAAFLAQVEKGCFACADANMDALVNNLDVTPYIRILEEASVVRTSTVPEPGTALMLAGTLLLTGWRGVLRQSG